MREQYKLGEAVQEHKVSVEREKLLLKAIEVVKESLIGIEFQDVSPVTVLEEAVESERRVQLSFSYATCNPINTDFIKLWQEQEYGDISLDKCIEDNYANYLELLSGEKPTPYYKGMAVVRDGLYSYEGKLYRWASGDHGNCPYIPGQSEFWQRVGDA